MHIIPRGRHESCFVLKNLNDLRRIYNSLLIPDPERSPPVHIRVICSQWSPIKNCDDVEKNIHTRLGIIYTGSEVLMPDLKLSGFPNCSKNLFIFIYQIIFINLCVTDPAVERIQVTDWFQKLKVMDLNISERINNSPFFINNKSIEKHYTQLILIIHRWKVLFSLRFFNCSLPHFNSFAGPRIRILISLNLDCNVCYLRSVFDYLCPYFLSVIDTIPVSIYA